MFRSYIIKMFFLIVFEILFDYVVEDFRSRFSL